MTVIMTFGAAQLLGRRADPEDLAETLSGLNRDAALLAAVRVLHLLALSGERDFEDDQRELVKVLPDDAQQRYAQLVSAEDAPVRLFHPLQQLAVIHAATRFSRVSGGLQLDSPEGRQRWGIASLQVSDLLERPITVSRSAAFEEKLLHLFAEQVTSWELLNPGDLNRSLARLMTLFWEVPAQGDSFRDAAERLKARFPQFLGVDADTAIALTALAAYWWVAQAPQLPTTPDAALIDQRTWLGDIALAPEALATYLDTLSFRPEDLPGLFDAFPIKGLDVRQVLPFRRRPFLRVDPDRVAIVCPQLVTEKGGIDLLWRLTHDPGGPKEVALWTADFGVLCEGYVQHVLTSSGSAVGGTWVSDIAWTIAKKAG
jgi:hypothetical protein